MKDNYDEEIIEENDEIDEAELIKGKKKFFIGMGLICIIIVLTFVGVVFQNTNIPWFTPVLIGSILALGIVSVILLVKNLPYIMLDEAIKMDNQYDSQELQRLSLSGINNMKNKFLENGFTLDEDGWYFKKKFSALKDSVSYCVKFAEGNNIEKIVDWQLDHINMDTKKGSNFCLIIFAYMDKIIEEDKATVKDYGINMIVSENALDPYKQMNLIVVAVDKTDETGWFMDIGNKHKISLYAYGCRLIKKMFMK